MTKNEYHHGNLKVELLKIAFDFIKENDVDNLTLKILGDATGTSRSAIYRHFASKDALIENMILEGFDSFDAMVTPILLDNSKHLLDRFYIAGKEYINFANNNPNLYRLLFGKKYATTRERLVSIKDEDCSGFGALKIAIEEGQSIGLLKKENSYEQSIILWSSLHGLSSLIIDGFMDVGEIKEKLYDRMFDMFLSGIASNKIKLLSTLPFANKLMQPEK
jgi:AcrR family transcriptional regulator